MKTPHKLLLLCSLTLALSACTSMLQNSTEQTPKSNLPTQSAPVLPAQSKARLPESKLAPARAEWADQIRSKVRANLVPPKGVKGQPTAQFRVQLEPNGKITSTELTRSSGNKALDAAISKAITRSSPLPLPILPEAFEPVLLMVFDPLND